MFSFQKYRTNGWLQALLDVGFIAINVVLAVWIARNGQRWDDQYLLWPPITLFCYAVLRGATLICWLVEAIFVRRLWLILGVLAHFILLGLVAYSGLWLIAIFSGILGVTPDGTEARY